MFKTLGVTLQLLISISNKLPALWGTFNPYKRDTEGQGPTTPGSNKQLQVLFPAIKKKI